MALAECCNLSLAAHVPREAVMSKFPKGVRGDARKALDRLRKGQLCTQHPTRGGTTWQLTLLGLRSAQQLVEGKRDLRPI